MNLKTQRLTLKELTMDDLEALHEILSDPESMKHYPEPFSLDKTKKWIQWNMENYITYGYGLWAVILKDENRLIGDCGITMQPINGTIKPELGYHIHKAYAGRGYASEAAMACRNYGFDVLKFEEIYSYQKYTNIASQRVAEKVGMNRVMEYNDEKNKITTVYGITLETYLTLKVEQNIYYDD